MIIFVSLKREQHFLVIGKNWLKSKTEPTYQVKLVQIFTRHFRYGPLILYLFAFLRAVLNFMLIHSKSISGKNLAETFSNKWFKIHKDSRHHKNIMIVSVDSKNMFSSGNGLMKSDLFSTYVCFSKFDFFANLIFILFLQTIRKQVLHSMYFTLVGLFTSKMTGFF